MKKKISLLEITPGCVSCSTCAAICPEVFEVKGTARVKPNTQLDQYAALIYQAVEMCPVRVINVKESTIT